MLSKKVISIIILFGVLVVIQLVSLQFFEPIRFLMRFNLLTNFVLFLILGFFIAMFLNSKTEGILISLVFAGLAILAKITLSTFSNSGMFATNISLTLTSAFSVSEFLYLLSILAGLIGGSLMFGLKTSRK